MILTDVPCIDEDEEVDGDAFLFAYATFLRRTRALTSSNTASNTPSFDQGVRQVVLPALSTLPSAHEIDVHLEEDDVAQEEQELEVIHALRRVFAHQKHSAAKEESEEVAEEVRRCHPRFFDVVLVSCTAASTASTAHALDMQQRQQHQQVKARTSSHDSDHHHHPHPTNSAGRARAQTLSDALLGAFLGGTPGHTSSSVHHAHLLGGGAQSDLVPAELAHLPQPELGALGNEVVSLLVVHREAKQLRKQQPHQRRRKHEEEEEEGGQRGSAAPMLLVVHDAHTSSTGNNSNVNNSNKPSKKAATTTTTATSSDYHPVAHPHAPPHSPPHAPLRTPLQTPVVAGVATGAVAVAVGAGGEVELNVVAEHQLVKDETVETKLNTV